MYVFVLTDITIHKVVGVYSSAALADKAISEYEAPYLLEMSTAIMNDFE